MNNVRLSPDAAQVYLGLNAGFYCAAGLSGAVFLLATGLTSLGTGAFPAWLALGEHRPRGLAPDRADRLDRARLRLPAVADRGQPHPPAGPLDIEPHRVEARERARAPRDPSASAEPPPRR